MSEARAEAVQMPVGISPVFLKREDLRSHLFGDVWKMSIPHVFKDVPTNYDLGNAVASLGFYGRWCNTFAVAVHRYIKNMPPTAKVLDVASGTHDVPLRLLAMNPTLEVHAVDSSPNMIIEGQRRAGQRHLIIHAEVCDAHTLSFADASFDVVTLQFSSRHLRIIKAFSEIYRVLKPGGIFCHNDMLRPSSRIVEVPYLAFLRISVWCTARLFNYSPETKRCVGYFADAIHNFYTPQEMTELLKEVGFVDVENRNFLTGVMSYHIAQKAAFRARSFLI